jgi:hypothetical protein
MTRSSDIAICTTAWKRPYYLRETLAAWERVRWIGQVRHFQVSLGASGRLEEARTVISELTAGSYHFPMNLAVYEDDGNLGPWRVNANAFIRAFEDPKVDFVFMAEEDILVADDVLEYIGWAHEEFADDKEVLVVNAHSRCGQGWDGPDVKDDPDADPAIVRLMPYFNQWGWGTWRDRFEGVLLPQWDYDGTSGTAMQSGHDWNIHLRSMRGHVAVTPDASRTQHIGDKEAWAANEYTLSWSKAASFRRSREPVAFEVTA